MISGYDQKRLDDAQKECDRKLAAYRARFARNAKFLIAIGLCLALYWYRYIGGAAFFTVGMLPFLMGAIFEMCVSGWALQKCHRVYKEIMGSDDDDDDPNGGKEIPKKMPQDTSSGDAKIIPFPKTEKIAA